MGSMATLSGVVAAASYLSFMASPGTVHVDNSSTGNAVESRRVGAELDGATLSVTAAGIAFDRPKKVGGASTGTLTTTSSNWSPPACWYAPKYTPEQLQAYLEPIWAAGSTGYEWDAEQRRKYDADDEKKAFNKHKSGEGYWWGAYIDKNYPPGWDSCDRDYFWVDTAEAPPTDIENAVTPDLLAELAYAEIRVPGTEVTLAPATATKVNLPTWAWLDAAEFKPVSVSVTASVPVLGLATTAKAKPVALHINPGTADAVTYPPSGVCRINNARIGEPYAQGKAYRTPPCGVRYLRSSGDGAHPLRATITWQITWTSTSGASGTLPNGTFGATQDVIVQEIQSVNR
ncbi:hypothetical protein [Streptomyces sp. NPDC003832]